jgi:hypothetical protein
MWEYLIARLTILITFGFGMLLIVLYPIINRESKIFAWISLIIGTVIIILGWDLARRNCITFTEVDDYMGFIPINVIQSINLVNIL